MNSATRDKPIGIFDSGMGGLTVMKSLMKLLPNEALVYLGDTARLPYGSKSPETVKRYAVQCARALLRYDIKMLVVACNTASATALSDLSNALAPTPVIGVIEPGAEAAVAAAPQGRIAVLATEGTVQGGAYVRAIHARNPRAQVVQKACPLFVSLAEEGVTDGKIPELVAALYLEPLLNDQANRPECLVLGCTHFPVLRDVIARISAPGPKLVDSADTTAKAVQHLLQETGLVRTMASAPAPRFLSTDAPERFARVGQIFLGHAIAPESVKLIDL
jgi:glutamate racemase